MLDQLQTAPALIDQVHDQLIAAIASGELPPGKRLAQESIAEMLGVSRQPVSHALQILKRRGLLVEHGRRGLAVAPLDRQLIVDLYEIRAALDGLAASLAAAKCKSGAAAKEAVHAFETALQSGLSLDRDADVKQLVAADVAFHAALYDLSGNAQIAATVAEQWPQFMRSMGFVLNSGGRRAALWSEHVKIAEAVLTGQSGKAEARAIAHARSAAKQAAEQIPELATGNAQ